MSMRTRVFIALLLAAGFAATIGGCSTEKPMPGATAGTFMDDSYLTTAVKSKLAVDDSLNSFVDIKVITENQVVTLKGTLPTTALRDQAIAVAKSVGGVKDVISEIEVKSP